MGKYIWPNYDECLLNLNASIQKFFGIRSNYKTLKEVDEELEKGYRTIVLLLLDGMGSFILDRYQDVTPFLREKKVRDYLSVFPSTTAAATTVLNSCIAPIESGWLGWHQYFKDIDKDVTMFNGDGYYDGSKNKPEPSSIYVPYKPLIETLNNLGYQAVNNYPAWSKEYGAKNINHFFKKIERFASSGEGKQYMYAYWDEPDHCLHDCGVGSKEVGLILKDLNRRIARLARRLPESTLLIVTADHGHHNIEEKYLYEHPDLLDTLIRLPSIEPRNATFFVKEGKKEEFVQLFNKYYGQDFILLSKEEVLERKLFGLYKPHPLSLSFIGDYQAIAIGDYQLAYKPNKEGSVMKSAHAGILEEEMTIPLILINNKKE